MEKWSEIRRHVLVKGVSKRQIKRDTGMHWKTLEKILSHSVPPGYRMKSPRLKPKLGPYLERIAEIIESDKTLPQKQRHTAKRIFDRLTHTVHISEANGENYRLKESKKRLKRRL